VLKPIRLFTALGAVFLVAVGLAACGGGVPGNSVAAVDGSQNITKDAYNHWLGVAAAAGASQGEKAVVPDPPNYTACIAHLEEVSKKTTKTKPPTAQLKSQCEQQFKALQQEVLGFLTSSAWVLGEAKAMGVKASDKEVNEQFEKVKNQQFKKPAEFEKFLATSGQTVTDLLLRVKLNMLSQKIQQKIVKNKPKITHAEILKYYSENKSKFGTGPTRGARIILTKGEAAAQEAKKEIESGKSFAEVAQKRSTDAASKAKGGSIGNVGKGETEGALSNALFAAKANTLGGPIKTPFGYYLYEVTAINNGNQQPVSTAESTIKQTLTSQQQQKALSTFIKNFKKKWQARTDCRSGFVVANCKQYKAPKTSTGTTSTTTPSTTTPTTTTTK
jgi:foldase protein PrsA